MAFLNPVVLFGLVAASIPLILHLLNLRKLRRVEFSSLRFLKELQKTRIRRVKVKQLLLLALRIALIVFAVMAFARPVFRGTSGLPGARASAASVVILDNTVSMSVKDDRGERLRRAKNAATGLLESMEEGDEYAIVSLSDPGSALDRGLSRNRESLVREIEEMTTGFGSAGLGDALSVSESLLQNSGKVNREIFIVTDAQRINAEGLRDSLAVVGRDTRVYFLPIGDEGDVPTNLAVDSIKLVSALFEADKPVTVQAWVHNYGDEEVGNATVSMNVEDRRLSQQTITVPAGESISVELSAPPRRTGFLGGYVEIDGDNLDADNRRYFAFRIVDGSRVAVVGPETSTRFLGVVLGLTGAVRPQIFGPNALATVDLSKFSSVILADVPSIGAGGGERLAEYVESGGGLVVYGGPSVNPAEFNGSLGAALGLPLGTAIDVPAGGSALEFGRVEKEHPVFAGVFDNASRSGRVESPQIRRALPAVGGDPIITLTNGVPFMTEVRRGRGKAIYVAVPPTMEWSDLPGRGIFVPIALRTALYTGAGGEAGESFTIGERALLVLPFRGDLPDQVQIVPPSGRDSFVPVRSYASGVSIAFDETDEPGIYRVLAAGTEVAKFAVNVPTRESDLRPMDERELRDLIAAKMEEPANLQMLEPGEESFADAVRGARVGLELWRYMLAMALICAFVEMAVGRSGSRSS